MSARPARQRHDCLQTMKAFLLCCAWLTATPAAAAQAPATLSPTLAAAPSDHLTFTDALWQRLDHKKLPDSFPKRAETVICFGCKSIPTRKEQRLVSFAYSLFDRAGLRAEHGFRVHPEANPEADDMKEHDLPQEQPAYMPSLQHYAPILENLPWGSSILLGYDCIHSQTPLINAELARTGVNVKLDTSQMVDVCYLAMGRGLDLLDLPATYEKLAGTPFFSPSSLLAEVWATIEVARRLVLAPSQVISYMPVRRAAAYQRKENKGPKRKWTSLQLDENLCIRQGKYKGESLQKVMQQDPPSAYARLLQAGFFKKTGCPYSPKLFNAVEAAWQESRDVCQKEEPGGWVDDYGLFLWNEEIKPIFNYGEKSGHKGRPVAEVLAEKPRYEDQMFRYLQQASYEQLMQLLGRTPRKRKQAKLQAAAPHMEPAACEGDEESQQDADSAREESDLSDAQG